MTLATCSVTVSRDKRSFATQTQITLNPQNGTFTLLGAVERFSTLHSSALPFVTLNVMPLLIR